MLLDRFVVSVINDINPDCHNWCYILNYDTIYGNSPTKATFDGSYVTIKDSIASTSHESDISRVDWSSCDIVIDATGVLSNVPLYPQVLDQGPRKVVVTHCPDSLIDYYLILGVNHQNYDPINHNIISSSICDATALAPFLRLFHSHLGIVSGSVVTLHPWLSYQNVMDGSSISWSVPGSVHTEYVLGRSIQNNIIPKPTSALTACKKSIGESLPWSSLASFSYRTNTSIVCSAHITLNLSVSTSLSNIDTLLSSDKILNYFNIHRTNDEPLVSSDYISSPESFIYDKRWTTISPSGKTITSVLWYDNEHGYASSLMRQLEFISAFF